MAGMRLGDLGADVIKIEPKTGDPARDMKRIIQAQTGLKGNDYYFETCNRNKRGIILDLKVNEGKEIFLKLIDQCDVFLTNMSIDAPLKLGIGPDALLSRNPRLIYAQASGWGRQGNDANAYSFDYTGIARTGLMMACGERGAPPSQVQPGIADDIGAIISAWAITIALYAREKTGRGQLVDTSLMGSLIAAMSIVMSAPAILGQEFPREIRSEVGNPLYNHYRCSDDKWVAVAHLQPDRYWPSLCRALGIEEFEKDVRFSSVEARGKNARELIRIMDDRFAGKTQSEWLKILRAEGCICTPVQSPGEVVNDPQALANDYFIRIQHPEWGLTKMIGFPWSFSATPPSWTRPAPKPGEHTLEVLLEAGYNPDEIEKFRATGAIT